MGTRRHGIARDGRCAVLRGRDKKPPALMDPTRERDRARILALFRPYRVRLAAVLVLIVISAGVGDAQPVPDPRRARHGALPARHDGC